MKTLSKTQRFVFVWEKLDIRTKSILFVKMQLTAYFLCILCTYIFKNLPTEMSFENLNFYLSEIVSEETETFLKIFTRGKGVP